VKSLEGLRNPVYAVIHPLISWLVGRRVHPNLLTTLGFIVTLLAALAFSLHRVSTAGFLILFGGFFDILDGRVARLTGLGSKFGAFYDSTLDRISEIVVFFGILSLYNDYRLQLGDVAMIYWIMAAMALSLMISYTRARAEGLGLDCKVGLVPRAERVVLIGCAALFFGETRNGLALKVVIILLVVLSFLTVIQRIFWVYRHAGGVPLEAPGGLGTWESGDDDDSTNRNTVTRT
jgi:CDP-diacylglycerol--glycerol-3-phosphate 3-phosphatidyltransferase